MAMTARDLAILFKQLVDDPDNTFFTMSDIAQALALGYFEYQQYVANQIPQIYEKSFDFQIPTKSVIWTGIPQTGDVATLVLGGVPYAYTVLITDTTMSQVAAKVAALTVVDPNFAVGAVGPADNVITKQGAGNVAATYVPIGLGNGGVTVQGVAGGEVNLDGIFFGASPTSGNSIDRITRIYSTNGNQSPNFGYPVVACDTLEELWNAGTNGVSGVYNQGRWCLQGTSLMFNAQLANTYRMYYLPTPNLNWPLLINTQGFVDNSPGFAQQLIAYYAVQAYAIRDWADNPALERKFQQLKTQLDKYLTKNRSGDSHRWVKASKSSTFSGW